MFIGSEYKELVEKKYAEALNAGVTEIILDQKTLGGLKLYVGTKPELTLNTFSMNDGVEVYVGGSLTETVS